MTRTLTLAALPCALVLAAACNPIVATPIVTGGAGGATSTASSSTGGASTGDTSLGGCGPVSSPPMTSYPIVIGDPGSGAVDSLAVGGGFVYWNRALTSVWKVPTVGGCLAEILPDGSGQVDYGGLRADGTNLYWSQWTPDGSNGVYKMPLTGGTPTLLGGTKLTTDDTPAFAVSATTVYWGNATANGPIMQVPIAGGTPTELVTTGMTPAVGGIAVDGSNVYWFDRTKQGVYSVPVAGGQVRTLVSGQGGDDLVVGGGWVYWTTDAWLAQVPAEGGAVTMWTGQSPSSPVVDDSYVYWVEGGDLIPGDIKKMPLGGGEPLTVPVSLHMGPNCPNALAVDDEFLYWGCGSGSMIMKAPKAP